MHFPLMSVYSNKAHNKWDEPASSALALCLLASSSGLGFDRSAPPLARIRRLHLMLYAHASFRQRYSDMSCQSPKQCNFQDFFRPSSGTFPLVKGSIPGRREREGGACHPTRFPLRTSSCGVNRFASHLIEALVSHGCMSACLRCLLCS